MTSEKILIIKLSALGDFLLALGAMSSIRKAHPDAHITLLTTRPFLDMATRSRYFNEVVIDKRPKFFEISEWIKLFKFFNGGNFTRVYDLQMNDRTGFYYKMFRTRPEWSGVVEGSKLFYPNPNWRDMHAFERHKQVLKIAGIDMTLPDTSWMDSDITLFGVKKPYVILVPGSAPTRPEKRWSSLRFGALGMKLIRQGYNVVVTGTNAERDAVERVVKSCPDIIDLSGKTSLYDIATLARGAAGAVGNDTGPTHLISLSGCPTVALFGPSSNPDHSAPVGDVRIIRADDLDDVYVDVVLKALEPR